VSPAHPPLLRIRPAERTDGGVELAGTHRSTASPPSRAPDQRRRKSKGRVMVTLASRISGGIGG
jgi:hypothetical protein